MEKLQYISQGLTQAEQEFNIKKVLDHGIRWVQVRWKNAGEKEFTALCEYAKQQCSDYGSVLIINDHVQVAKNIDADGVHVGLNDMAVDQARQLLGKDKIIGGTANTFTDVLQRVNESCDYIGLGPLRFTPTKEQLSPVLGFEGYERIIRNLGENSVKIPKIFAIGGVVSEDIDRLRRAGIYGVAVSGQITAQPDMISIFKTALNHKSMILPNE